MEYNKPNEWRDVTNAVEGGKRLFDKSGFDLS